MSFCCFPTKLQKAYFQNTQIKTQQSIKNKQQKKYNEIIIKCKSNHKQKHQTNLPNKIGTTIASLQIQQQKASIKETNQQQIKQLNNNKQRLSHQYLHPQKRQYDILLEKLNQYYDDHQIDHAYNTAKIILNHHNFQLQKQKSKKQKKLVRKVVRQYQQVLTLERDVQREGWIQKYNQNRVSVKIRHEDDKTVSSLTETELLIPYEIMIATITQFDLYPQYVPFVPQARTMKKAARNCRIAWTKHKFPIITAREANFIARGYDRLNTKGQIFCFVTSIQGRQDLQQQYEYVPQINKDAISLSYKFLILTYTPIQQGRGNVKIYGNIDSKMNFLPIFAIQWMTVQFGKDFFRRIVQIGQKFKGSKWQQKIKQDPSTFDWNRLKIQEYLKKKKQIQQQIKKQK